jgi:hypothetical protein
MNKRTVSKVMREMGRKGGKIGGKRSLETMTPEERTARAKKAVAAREAKRGKSKPEATRRVK